MLRGVKVSVLTDVRRCTVVRRLPLERILTPTCIQRHLDKVLYAWELDAAPIPKLYAASCCHGDSTNATLTCAWDVRYNEKRMLGDYLNNPNARKGTMPEPLGRYISCRFFREGTFTLPEEELLPRGMCVCRQHRNDGECPVLRDLLQNAKRLKDPRWAHVLDSMGPEVKAAIDAGDRDSSFLARWWRGYGLQLSHREALVQALNRKWEVLPASHVPDPPDSDGKDDDVGGGDGDITSVTDHNGSTHGTYVMQASDDHGQRARDPVFACIQAQWETEFSREAFRDAFANSVRTRRNLRVGWDGHTEWDAPKHVVVTTEASRYFNPPSTRSVASRPPSAPSTRPPTSESKSAASRAQSPLGSADRVDEGEGVAEHK